MIRNIVSYGFIAVLLLIVFWVWYALGFFPIEGDLELAISIIWWLMIGIGIFVIIQAEKTRRAKKRTLYVSEDILFNSERGTTLYNGLSDLVKECEEALESLHYSYREKEMPNQYAFPTKAIIKTDAYKKEKRWKGVIEFTEESTSHPFQSKNELCSRLRESSMFHEEAIENEERSSPHPRPKDEPTS